MGKKIKCSPVVASHAREIGESIATWRKMSGITAKELAARASTSPRTISKLENGDVGVSIGTVLAVARVLGVLERVDDAFDPYETDRGRALIGVALPERVRK